VPVNGLYVDSNGRKVLALKFTSLMTANQSRLSGASVSNEENFKLDRSLETSLIYMLASCQPKKVSPERMRVKRKSHHPQR
jgi:hypothetical protein